MKKKLIIKIRGSLDKDLKEIRNDPSKVPPNGSHTLYLKSVEDLYDLLSPKKLEMLQALLNYPESMKTVTEVSKKTKRKQEAISRDVTALSEHNLIEKIKQGRNVLLKAKYDTLEIQLA
ncbi:MAG TPA: hypothetical protein HA254_03250 [Candidatus Diapherotrites archaeon]|uniref:Transcriptional regulator n=1 Tax=Candidatus Iainarchaeum sp. TaxID=3101447 RepID=A0A7J4IZE9_9ARCH|nr:hypothetical protein [Candidatus Diapherotrites archaeon]